MYTCFHLQLIGFNLYSINRPNTLRGLIHAKSTPKSDAGALKSPTQSTSRTRSATDLDNTALQYIRSHLAL